MYHGDRWTKSLNGQYSWISIEIAQTSCHLGGTQLVASLDIEHSAVHMYSTNNTMENAVIYVQYEGDACVWQN